MSGGQLTRSTEIETMLAQLGPIPQTENDSTSSLPPGERVAALKRLEAEHAKTSHLPSEERLAQLQVFLNNESVQSCLVNLGKELHQGRVGDSSEDYGKFVEKTLKTIPRIVKETLETTQAYNATENQLTLVAQELSPMRLKCNALQKTVDDYRASALSQQILRETEKSVSPQQSHLFIFCSPRQHSASIYLKERYESCEHINRHRRTNQTASSAAQRGI